MELTPSQTATLNLLKTNKPFFFKNCLQIRTKSGEFKPFIMNKGQMTLHNELERLKKERQYLRIVLVKGRQMGASTYIAARFFHDAIFNTGLATFILTHHTDSTSHLFQMVRNYYDFLPEALKATLPLKASNRKELILEHQRSSYHVGTAGTGAIGRGTTVQRFHCSEVASWANTDELSTGVLNAIGDIPGTELILESTANGIGNYFHNMALSGLREGSKFKTIFLPWYWMPEYATPCPKGYAFSSEDRDIQALYNLTDNQMYWRRQKIDDDCEGRLWKFQQEYPLTLHEAFVTSGARLLDAERVQRARKNNLSDPTKAVVQGIDPSHEKDRTVFVIRQGRKILHHQVCKGGTVDDPAIAGIAAENIERYSVDHTFIDIGAGYGAYDILCGLGYGAKTTKIHFSQKPILSDVFAYKGDEMANAVREWFREQECDIPDDEEFVGDLLVIPDLKHTTGRQLLKLPDKEEIKTLLNGMSCDIFDALRLTFAFPVVSQKMKEITKDISSKIQKKSNQRLSRHRSAIKRIGLR